MQCDEISLKQDTAKTDTKGQSHSKSDRAFGRNWFKVSTQEVEDRSIIGSVRQMKGNCMSGGAMEVID